MPDDLISDAAAEVVANISQKLTDGRRLGISGSSISMDCLAENQRVAVEILRIARVGGGVPRDMLNELFAPCPSAHGSSNGFFLGGPGVKAGTQ